MKSTKELLHQINDTSLPVDERALLRCRLAKQLEEVGNYDAAREALGELWEKFEDPPNLAGLSDRTSAEVLLRVGTLTGWIGSTRQTQGAQETAKDRITQSIAIFESIGDLKKIAEAETEIAYCYWREGAIDEALVAIKQALAKLDDETGDLKGVALVRKALFEKVKNRLNEAFHTLEIAAPLFEASTNHTLKGRFHNEFGNVLRRLGDIEKSNEYIDRAIIEYTAATFHFELAGHDRYQACVENNLAMILFKANRIPESYHHLDRAETLFTTLNDVVHLAQVAETRASVMLSEGALVQAERNARRAVQLLESGDERSLLAEALTTQAIALSRLSHKAQARVAFERAIQVAEDADDLESAGLAGLALVEEIQEDLSDEELFAILESADDRLKNTQNAALLRRQKNCFRRFASRLMWPDWPLSLDRSVRRLETKLIRRALEDTGGVIKQAAGLLELSRQRLQKILKNRHKDLRQQIPEIKARARDKSLKEDEAFAFGKRRVSEKRTARILHVEDNALVAGMVKEMLENQGWQVETCSDGNLALEKILGVEEYDLLLVDYGLPGVNGLELINRARELDHRCATPMVVLSASPVEAAAREAGADVFLRKPQDVSILAEEINRLLDERAREQELS